MIERTADLDAASREYDNAAFWRKYDPERYWAAKANYDAALAAWKSGVAA